MNVLTTPLSKHHKRDHFECENEALTHYLKEHASQDLKRNLALCFVATDTTNRITGYYTLSNGSIPRDQLPEAVSRKLGYKQIPVTLLGRLARDISKRGTGLGESLLMDALYRSYHAAKESTGSLAVVTDPIDDNAAGFYKRYGFIRLEGSKRLFIVMETLEGLFSI